MNTLATRRFQKRYGEHFTLHPTEKGLAVVCATCNRFSFCHSWFLVWAMVEAARGVAHQEECSTGLFMAADKAKRRRFEDRRYRAELEIVRAHARGVRF